MSVIAGMESDRLYELDRAAQEWRTIRKTIFATRSDDLAMPALWKRLAEAENRLMAAMEGWEK